MSDQCEQGILGLLVPGFHEAPVAFGRGAPAEMCHPVPGVFDLLLLLVIVTRHLRSDRTPCTARGLFTPAEMLHGVAGSFITRMRSRPRSQDTADVLITSHSLTPR